MKEQTNTTKTTKRQAKMDEARMKLANLNVGEKLLDQIVNYVVTYYKDPESLKGLTRTGLLHEALSIYKPLEDNGRVFLARCYSTRSLAAIFGANGEIGDKLKVRGIRTYSDANMSGHFSKWVIDSDIEKYFGDKSFAKSLMNKRLAEMAIKDEEIQSLRERLAKYENV